MTVKLSSVFADAYCPISINLIKSCQNFRSFIILNILTSVYLSFSFFNSHYNIHFFPIKSLFRRLQTKANVSCTVSLARVIVRGARVFIKLESDFPNCRAAVTGSYEYRLKHPMPKIHAYF